MIGGSSPRSRTLASRPSSSSPMAPTPRRSSARWSARAPGSHASSWRVRRSTRFSSIWWDRRPPRPPRSRASRRRGRALVHKVWAIIRREFVERVRTKWFWVSAILGPVLFAGIIVFQIMQSVGGGVRNIAIVDAGKLGYGTRIVEALGASRTIRADGVKLGPAVLDSLTSLVEAKQLNGFLIVGDSMPTDGKAEYRASNLSLQTIEELQRTLNRVVEKARLEGKGVNPAVVDWAQALRVTLAQKKIARGEITTENAGQSFALAYVMAILLFMAILLYGVNVMSS